jgi:choline dehydrogenase
MSSTAERPVRLSTAGTFDYIVVGGGTAGCVLASRLSAKPDVRVLLLEAGGWDRHPLIHVPAGFAKLPASLTGWGYVTSPQPHCDGREIPLPQGKVIGGGGSVNAQVFLRGAHADYDAWRDTYGCDGWDFESVLPYFIRSERNSRLAAPWHGDQGPMAVSDPVEPQVLSRAFLRAAQEAGLPVNDDFNGARQFGAGYYQTSTSTRRLRCSAATGYLHPVRRRPNLTVQTRGIVSRILIEAGAAVGVEFRSGLTAVTFRATREVIVAAGTMGSPKLLLLSGIGDPAELADVGVKTVLELAGVGRNLHDHWSHELIYRTADRLSLDRYAKTGPATVLAVGDYLARRRGPLASTVAEAGAFVSSGVDGSEVDLQLTFLPAARDKPGFESLPPGYGCSLSSWVVRPRSRGRLRLRSADAGVAPIIDPNYLADPYDLDAALAALAHSRDIMSRPALSRYLVGEHYPGIQAQTRAELSHYIRSVGRTGYHHVGTCAMGTHEDAVVDAALRVRGIDRLRVCDASVMPSIVSSNTMAATVMIAEKGADLILADG